MRAGELDVCSVDEVEAMFGRIMEGYVMGLFWNGQSCWLLLLLLLGLLLFRELAEAES